MIRFYLSIIPFILVVSCGFKDFSVRWRALFNTDIIKRVQIVREVGCVVILIQYCDIQTDKCFYTGPWERKRKKKKKF